MFTSVELVSMYIQEAATKGEIGTEFWVVAESVQKVRETLQGHMYQFLETNSNTVGTYFKVTWGSSTNG